MTGDMTDSSELRSAAGMLESLANELREVAAGDSTLFAYKSAANANLVATTLREWAHQLLEHGFFERLMKNEAILRMVKPSA